MKYIVVLGDGMADYPIDELNEQTPLEYANTPMMDELAQKSEIGQVHTIPAGMSPGSDTANLSVLGYDPKKYYTGRSPLEALSIGVPMKDTDIAIRCNIVTVSDEETEYKDKKMIDHSAGEISTEDADVLIQAVQEAFGNEMFHFYTGTSYRHLLIWDKGNVVELTPPHDILTKTIGNYLPKEKLLAEMMEKSYEILNNHPINVAREKAGLHKANSLWFWGAGTKPALDDFTEKTGKRGVMISAVDLLKGIGVGAGLHNIIVEGADGTLETNYEGKAQAAVDALTKDGYDFAYIHVEAPDEMGHQGSVERKIKSIEYLDQRVIRVVKEGMDASGEDYRMLVLPDHPTPIVLRTHSSDPVPYMLFDSTNHGSRMWHYNEREAAASGIDMPSGAALMEYFLD
ncbi:cofactor-independent phosphoglycerate mutase [Eubacterium sp. An3]|uniref:cofactor-independent phosphoglycerate mutase n=1 Tax=Eubacterium sp. An3 TaxID=1965628 RepID=UPI0007A90D20|nr:cofactor-independent phosphoglycerate mutase [Eubacterium sp. An3]OUO25970.1 cofactor-independent phosphoglycerate mutase [Eubacterium sp. An3]CVI68741.1 cofactor-independent phosphoglycerate mutase [Eubacteriaceae bacterium CHKCI004]